jgi:ATPase subunit of ABC transporter with duplicated ATPase domains
MLLHIDIAGKTLGAKQLFHNVQFSVETGEKLAIVGRNGVGKTTLFRLLTGQDNDFDGQIIYRRGARVVSTAQEHLAVGEQSVLDYILSNLPDYARLKHIIDTYPNTMGDDIKKIQTYTNALEQFSSLDYYTIDDHILMTLGQYQINEVMARGPLKNLSGGQKRFVELTRIEHSDADIALIDEPTNHMDYIAKQAFIDWFSQTKLAVVVISHDRDVLQCVQRIIELKDGRAQSFKGNYEAYLKQNALTTATKMHDYEVSQRRMVNLKADIVQFRRLKEKARDPDTIKQFKRREQQAQAELATLESVEKPSFWIDRESAEGMKKQVSDNYQKYKAKNIRIHHTQAAEGRRQLLHVDDLQLSYSDKPLFKPVNFRLHHGDKLQLVGRNGVGKTTLVKAIMTASRGEKPQTLRAGHITTDSKLRLSVYEQEVGAQLMDLTLADAIEHIYRQQGLNPTNETIMKVMGNYLFDPYVDARLRVTDLSGGQKARLQIIKMLASGPNLLILDEPTNHLDLPSIEELENALKTYHGALLYISHDSYFATNMGGEKMTLEVA